MSALARRRERYEAALAAARAARVPDEDFDGPGREPVTVTGWYGQPTISGRPAWRHYAWRSGRCVAGHATYDLRAEDALAEAELDYEPWFHEAQS